MAVRRAAVDALGSQLSANHYLIRRDYEKVLRHKNRLLKDEAPASLVAALDETLVMCGAQLACYRAALFEKLSERMASYYAEIADGRERLRACYVPSWEAHDPAAPATFSFGRDDARMALASALAARGGEERARRRALVGPHADRIEFFIDGRNVSSFASQGQQRSVVLAFKLAEAALVQDIPAPEAGAFARRRDERARRRPPPRARVLHLGRHPDVHHHCEPRLLRRRPARRRPCGEASPRGRLTAAPPPPLAARYPPGHGRAVVGNRRSRPTAASGVFHVKHREPEEGIDKGHRRGPLT